MVTCESSCDKEYMCNIKALLLLVWKLWPRLKFLSTQPMRTWTLGLWHKFPRHICPGSLKIWIWISKFMSSIKTILKIYKRVWKSISLSYDAMHTRLKLLIYMQVDDKESRNWFYLGSKGQMSRSKWYKTFQNLNNIHVNLWKPKWGRSPSFDPSNEGGFA